ncbi:MAG: ferritin-like domain-containing protein [Chloroflexia bacterium]|nr:ferritin-like domain-containing protein [Chloroflexia bacterium]
MLQKALDTRLQDVSRRRLLRNAAVAGGGLAALGAPSVAFAQDATPEGDASPVAEESPFEGPVDVLNYALTLELLENAFYRDGLATFTNADIEALGFLPGVYDYLIEIGAHEAVHVETLTSVINDLGGEPVEEATYEFPYEDAAGFIEVALALEDTGVAAYTGAAQYLIEEDDLLTAALTIHGVEARHASYLALLNAGDPFPAAFNDPLTPEEVLEIATPFFATDGGDDAEATPEG